MNVKAKTLLNEDEDQEFLKSLKEDFYVETLDSFEKSEASLLDFESTQNELKKLEYKRILHSVKGSAKAVGEDHFAKVVHQVEDSLGCVDNEAVNFHFKFLDIGREYVRARMKGDDSLATSFLLEMENIIKSK